MKLKYVGEADHLVVFAETTYIVFEKDEVKELSDDVALSIMAKHHKVFEKEEKQKAAPKAKVLPEVAPHELKQ
jgi:hypothetical protein